MDYFSSWKTPVQGFKPSRSLSLWLFIYFALSFGKRCTCIMKSKYYTLYCQTKFIRFMCQWWGQGPHTESFLSRKNFSWNIKYGKWGDPLLPENRISPLLMAPKGSDELRPWLSKHASLQTSMGELSEGEGPQWKLKGIYSEEATCVQLHAGLTSRCMRQQALWGHGKWKLGNDKWKAFSGLGAHRHGIR